MTRRTIPAGGSSMSGIRRSSPKQTWASRWDDLADFEIVPVQTSQDYWAGLAAKKNRPG